MAVIICKERNVAINQALIVIPDISGFTQFMTQAELLHGQSIIAELLEGLLDAEELGLQISEIEGDAILFYKFNCDLNMVAIVRQCRKMFLKFHTMLRLMHSRMECPCKTCRSLEHLSLKFIIHVGELGSVMIKNYCKLFGVDVIIAHRLLKNDIPYQEYLLFTDAFVKQCSSEKMEAIVTWTEVEKGTQHCEGVGKVNFHYATLHPLLHRGIMRKIPL